MLVSDLDAVQFGSIGGSDGQSIYPPFHVLLPKSVTTLQGLG